MAAHIVRSALELCIMPKLPHPKARTVRNSDRQIRKDSEEPVRSARFECQVVRYLMYGQEQILVRCCANEVRCEDEGP